jgi:anti-sigma factor RsiW
VVRAHGDEHVEHELGVFVLGLLPVEEEQAIADHLAGCARCQAETAELRQVRALLDRLDDSSIAQLRQLSRDTDPESTPPPDVAPPREANPARDRPATVSGPPGRPGSSGPPSRPSRRRPIRLRVVLAALVVTLVAGVGLGSWLTSQAPVDIRLAGTQWDNQTGVSASVTVVPASGGSHVDATVRGLVAGEAYRLYAVGNRGDSEVVAEWVSTGSVEGVAGEITITTDRLTAVTLTRRDETVLLTVRLSPSGS